LFSFPPPEIRPKGREKEEGGKRKPDDNEARGREDKLRRKTEKFHTFVGKRFSGEKSTSTPPGRKEKKVLSFSSEKKEMRSGKEGKRGAQEK